MESQTPRNFTLFSGHLKFFSGKSFSLLPAIDPIQKASVFLLFSLRPVSLPKFSIVLSVADKDSFVPLSIKVVSSAYWLILTSDVVPGSPWFNFSAALVNSQLACLRPVGIPNSCY